MARRKEENTMLSENLFMVADSRDMMEKFFAKKLRLLRTDLISEKHLRFADILGVKLLKFQLHNRIYLRLITTSAVH